MDSLYTLYDNQLKQFINTRRWPRGFRFDIVERHDRLILRIDEGSMVCMGAEDLQQVSAVVGEVMTAVRGLGVPIFVDRKR